MVVLILAVPGATPMSLLFQGVVLRQRPNQIVIFLTLNLQLRRS